MRSALDFARSSSRLIGRGPTKYRRPAVAETGVGSAGSLQRALLISLDSVIIIAVGVRRSLKQWIGRVLGKSGPPVVAVFLSGDAALARSMALRMRELVPDYPHVIIGAGEIDRSHFKYAQDIIVVNPHRLLASWLELRRRLGRRWIALAPFLWQSGEQSEADNYRLLRWLPWLLAPRKLLAFNARLERHHVRLRLPIASWRFLRGEPVGDILRPTPLGNLKKLWALAGFPLVTVCWAAVQMRRRPPAALSGDRPTRPGVTVLVLPEKMDGAVCAELDRSVQRADTEHILIIAGGRDLPPATHLRLAALLERPRTWLAYTGRKISVAGGVPVDAPVKTGEDATWALCSNPAAARFRRDVYLALGGMASLESAYGGAAWLALSLLGWQRGWHTLFAGAAEAPVGRDFAQERLVLGAICNFRTAIPVLWEWSWDWRRWKGALSALGATSTPPPTFAEAPCPEAKTTGCCRNFWPLLDPRVHVFEGRRPSGRQQVAIVSPYLPFPLSHGGAIRIFNLTRTAGEHADISLFAFAEKETGREVEPLLRSCRRVVLVETPRWEPAGLLRLWPRGVCKFRSRVMRAAISLLVRDEQIPVVQVEYTQLAHLRSAAAAPARTVLVEHDVTFDLYRQLRVRAQGWEKVKARLEELRWKRFELGFARGFDRVIVMSQEERARLLRAGLPPERVAVVENGVDLDRFRPLAPEPLAPPELLFIGSFRHFPNVLGFEFLVRQVWPTLRQTNPELTLTVVAGADHEYYWERHTNTKWRETRGIDVLGFVEDVRPLYRRATVVAIPLLVSAGTNIKVLEALAMGRPVVSTLVGVAGLGLTTGENVLIADTAREFSEAVSRLLEDGALRAAIARRGREFVEERYGWDALGEKLARLWDDPHFRASGASAKSSKAYRPARA